MTEPHRFSEHDLVTFAAACFRTYDVSAHDAHLAAEALVAADLRGVHSHGLLLLARYCTQLRQGGVVARPSFRVVRDSSATALVDGGAGLAQVTAVKAMRIALDKAAEHGVGMVAVRNSHHFGSAAHYATLALERGMIGFASTNAGVTMTAPGAVGRLIGNNPFAFAVPAAAELPAAGKLPAAAELPAAGEYPFVLDMAMSQSSGGRIRRMADTGEAIPLGWVVDEHGNDTTAPADYGAGGALLPIGGHKGFGLALMIEILSAVLSGASTTTDVRIDTLEPDVPAGMGHLLLAIDIATFRDVAEFASDLRHLLGKVASPVTRARVPGSASGATVARARHDGVPLPGDVVSLITRLAADLSVALPTAH